jgi:hypothetical protein
VGYSTIFGHYVGIVCQECVDQTTPFPCKNCGEKPIMMNRFMKYICRKCNPEMPYNIEDEIRQSANFAERIENNISPVKDWNDANAK